MKLPLIGIIARLALLSFRHAGNWATWVTPRVVLR
jgi:hypothetical protein